jgi:putative acetyltransferase
VGRSRAARRARRRDARRSHLSAPDIHPSGRTVDPRRRRENPSRRRENLRELTDTPSDVDLGSELVREYVLATAIEQAGPGQEPDLGAILPHIPDWDDFAGRFLRSGGAFVVATVDDAVAGCVGVTPLDAGVCEMNRLWVREPFRTDGLGRRLAAASMDTARRLGFTRMLLDVIPARTRAIALYESLGFVEVPPTHEYAFPMRFFGRDL